MYTHIYYIYMLWVSFVSLPFKKERIENTFIFQLSHEHLIPLIKEQYGSCNEMLRSQCNVTCCLQIHQRDIKGQRRY